MLKVWGVIAFVAAFAVAGEVLIASGMRDLGDLDIIRSRSGLLGTIRAVLDAGFELAYDGMELEI